MNIINMLSVLSNPMSIAKSASSSGISINPTTTAISINHLEKCINSCDTDPRKKLFNYPPPSTSDIVVHK